jgi:GxxExxY protein
MRESFQPELAQGAIASPHFQHGLLHKGTTDAVIGSAISVHKSLGPGLLESAYEACLVYALGKRALKVRRQVEVPIQYDGILIDAGFRIDLVVDDKVIVELKAIEKLAPIHEAQLNTYLRLTKLRVGLLINFNSIRLRDGIVRRIL